MPVNANVVHGNRVFKRLKMCKYCDWCIKEFAYVLFNFFNRIVAIFYSPFPWHKNMQRNKLSPACLPG